MKVINRIKKYEEFQTVINEGAFVKNDSFNVYYKPNNIEVTRIGISIPKKTGHAVVRNKVKRQIRAIIAHECNMNLSKDIIIIARKSYDVSRYEKTSADLCDILVKVGLKK